MSDKGLSKKYIFKDAAPVWVKGKETEMNYSVIFRAAVDGDTAVNIHVSAHCRYQLLINGAFFAAGPARSAHGFYRVDEYEISRELLPGDNVISFIVAGYNVNSFYLLDEPSFFCAEILRDGEVLRSTGNKEKGFEALEYLNRTQRVQRFSYQRPFTECYVYDAYYDAFLTHPDEKFRTPELIRTEDKNFIYRTSPYCTYDEKKAEYIVAKGIRIPVKEPEKYSDRSLTGICDTLKGFTEDKLECPIVNELNGYTTQVLETEKYLTEPVSLGVNCTVTYDMGLDTTGYIRISLTAQHDTVIYAVFNEVLGENMTPFAGRDNCANAVKWALQGGRTYDIFSFEPYAYRYIEIISMYAPVLITNVSQYRETYPKKELTGIKEMSDEKLGKIYAAAVETFSQNATDIFTDCPGRERAGWLCDSFFTARVEKELTGQSRVEHDFLENFILPEKFTNIPDGMLPMCYPADHPNGSYIHNWAMWFVLQLWEYDRRSGDKALINAAKERVYKLLGYTATFENADGLLQNIGGWVFVEWSEANSFTQDINYPSNMLYALCLQKAGELYGDNGLIAKADTLRETIRNKAYNGEFFIDNAIISENGTAVNTMNCTETCQYYAFFTKTATKETHPELYDKLVNVFGPARKTSGAYPDIYESNAFIGNYLRLQILFEDGRYDKVKEEISEFFLPMAEKTGTLWENMTEHASCNHGFASHVIYWLNNMP